LGFTGEYGMNHRQELGRQDLAKGTVSFGYGDLGQAEVRHDEVFLSPLDIGPHQSESRWLAIAISATPRMLAGEKHVSLIAYDVQEKEMARTGVNLPKT
jgi:hypothetical protein